MSEHTPGPWKWNGLDDLKSTNGSEVLTVELCNGEPPWLDCSKPDRSLIAAAPEMYALLQRVIDAHDDAEFPEDFASECESVANAARRLFSDGKEKAQPADA